MTKKIYIFSLIFIFALLPFSLMAIKAKPGILNHMQPDGTQIKIMLHGDENFHYATTPDSLLILLNQEGIYEYAVSDDMGIPVASGVNALKASSTVVGKTLKNKEYIERLQAANTFTKEKISNGRAMVKSQVGVLGTPNYRFSSSAFPTKGDPHSLVILVEYQDVRFKMQDPLEYFEDFLNGDNFSRDNATGSCRKYYSENSAGLFTPTFDVFGPILLKNAMAYYGGGDEENAYQMVTESVTALDPIVDFSKYDHNADGFVDSVYIIYAGNSEADGGPEASVWPFSWELVEEGVTLKADGVQFNTYGCSNEIQADGDIEGIGTFTHEFGHVMGLPDLYNTVSSSDYSTPNDWSLMDSGSYNDDCRTPPNLSSFERYSLGWLTPDEIVSTGKYYLDPIADSNKAYIMTSEEKKDEFFIMDYRVQEGWDASLPYHGILIWHIDFNQRAWDSNVVNNTRSHQRVRLLRADNVADFNTMTGDPFPGTKKVTSLSSLSSPSLQTWDKKKLNVTTISGIKEDNGRASFTAVVSEDRSSVSSVTGNIEGSEVEINKGVIRPMAKEVTVFDVSGRVVGVASPGNPLQVEPGLYIVGGKKILVRR